MPKANPEHKHLVSRLTECGVRRTPQRELVYGIILRKRDHPTADEIFARAKARMPGISLATVYNCLESLVGGGLVRQVTLERGATRYCPNLHEHAHFHDRESGAIHDIDLPDELLARIRAALPAGFDMQSIELTIRGSAHPTPASNN
jgi:Fur family peroxide stress response transcriptional regulator